MAKSHVVQEFDRYHAAVGAERYRVTAIRLAADGTKKVFIVDKKNGETVGFTPDELRQRSRELLHLERRGENLYYTPLSTAKHHILVDDMTKENLARFLGAGFKPAVVIESSPGNFQAVLSVRKLGTPHDQEIGNRLSLFLNREYGDPNLSGAVHPHRAPGYSNRKPERRMENGLFPVVKLIQAEARECDQSLTFCRQLLAERQTETTRAQPRPAVHASAPAAGTAPAAVAYVEHHRDIITRFGQGDIDYSRLDAMIAVRLRATGHDRADVAAAVERGAPTIRPPERRGSHQWEDYAQRTANYAFGQGGDQQLERTRRFHDDWRRLETQPPAPHHATSLPDRAGPDTPDI